MKLRSVILPIGLGLAAIAAMASDAPASRRPFTMSWCVTGAAERSISIEATGLTRDAVMLYEHDFGTYPRIYQGVSEHGGVPQQADLTSHLSKVRADLDRLIPDVNFSGWAIIDYEAWDPVWSASRAEYHELSKSLVRARRPDRSERDIERLAKAAFESGAITILERTLELCKQLRPRAKWGYYGMPFWHQRDARHLDRLLAASTALYPSVYVQRQTVDANPGPNQITVKEHRDSTRMLMDVARRAAGPQTPVIALVSARYCADRERPNDPPMLTPQDTRLSLELAPALGADGLAFWDAVDGPDLAARYNTYVRDVLVPELTRFRREVLSSAPPQRELPGAAP